MNEGRFLRLLATALTVLCVSVAAACDDPVTSDLEASTTLSASQGTGISGTWTLNPEQSEGPGGQMHDGQGRRRGPRRRMGGGELVITQDESSVTFSGGGRGGRGGSVTQTFPTDGSTVTRETARGQVEITASLDGDVLVMERSSSDGATATQSFTPSDDGQQLFVTNNMQHPDRDEVVEFRLVYDRV